LNNDNSNLGKIDAKLYETILLTYSPFSKNTEFTLQECWWSKRHWTKRMDWKYKSNETRVYCL